MVTVHIIDQMQWAQDSFTFVMDTLNHDSAVLFEDKAAMVDNYKVFFPLWPHNIIQLQDALDRINPAYQGRAKWCICGEVFWVVMGQWALVEGSPNNSSNRIDSYLYAKTGEIYTLEYIATKAGNQGIKLNGEFVWLSTTIKRNELPEYGVNALLIRLGLLPF